MQNTAAGDNSLAGLKEQLCQFTEDHQQPLNTSKVPTLAQDVSFLHTIGNRNSEGVHQGTYHPVFTVFICFSLRTCFWSLLVTVQLFLCL